MPTQCATTSLPSARTRTKSAQRGIISKVKMESNPSYSAVVQHGVQHMDLTGVAHVVATLCANTIFYVPRARAVAFIKQLMVCVGNHESKLTANIDEAGLRFEISRVGFVKNSTNGMFDNIGNS